ncbi:hypothetical protein DSECCO2_556450 [anaerobic digester metagenome]
MVLPCGIGQRDTVAKVSVQIVENTVCIQILGIQHAVTFRTIDIGVIAISVHLSASQIKGIVPRFAMDNAIQTDILIQSKNAVLICILGIGYTGSAIFCVEILVYIPQIHCEGYVRSIFVLGFVHLYQ